MDLKQSTYPTNAGVIQNVDVKKVQDSFNKIDLEMQK
jgi:hypothetical protein